MVHLSSEQLRDLSEIFGLLSSDSCEDPSARAQVGILVKRLLRADYYGSHVWDPRADKFVADVTFDISANAVAAYNDYYQFHDPISLQLRRMHPSPIGPGFFLPSPTRVSQIAPEHELTATEFFSDFLRKENMYWGVNLQVSISERCTADMRLWRDKRHGDFDLQDLAILSLISPSFQSALRRSVGVEQVLRRIGQGSKLTSRESQVAALAARGLADKEIADRMQLSPTTVRTQPSLRTVKATSCSNSRATSPVIYSSKTVATCRRSTSSLR